MTEDEKRDLNRRVAEAMGAEFRVLHGGVGQNHATGKPYPVEFPQVRLPGHATWKAVEYNFCADPAAADLVRLEIERRGWIWSIDPGINDKRYFCYVSGGSPRCAHGPYGMAEGNEWTEALCLAFLEAVADARKTEGPAL
jgi:hypothetical protein